MSEETTNRLDSGDSFGGRVLSELAALREGMSRLDSHLSSLEGKVDALEEKVDARLRETRPIWEGVLARLDRMDAKFDVFAREMLEMRADIVLLQKRQPPAA